MFRSNPGHLLTVTSQEENGFVFNNISKNRRVWLAGSDADTEGTWRWLAGPEAGEVFQAGSDSGMNYTHWMVGEPNGGSAESYLEMYGSIGTNWPGTGPEDMREGYWNDAPPSSLFRFVVEYEPQGVFNLVLQD